MIERRFIELRSLPEAGILVGTAVRYGDKARIFGLFDEVIEPRAFGADVAKGDVSLNLQHIRASIFARTGPNGGLTLADNAERLEIRAEIPAELQAGRDALAGLQRGLFRGLSVEMRVKEDRNQGGARHIVAADLVAIALVDSPAYGDSEAELAKRFRAEPARRRRIPVHLL